MCRLLVCAFVFANADCWFSNVIITGVGFIKRKMAASVTPKVEFIKVADNQIRIVTTGPKKTEDRTVTVGQEVEETDPLDNVIKVIMS